MNRAGVCGVVGFGNARVVSDTDAESNLNLSTIKQLWSRGGWIAYFICLELVSSACFWLSTIIHEVWMEKQELETKPDPSERELTRRPSASETFWQRVNRQRRIIRSKIKKQVENFSVARPDIVLRKILGLAWAVSGGLLAGQTLVFAKSAVKLISTAVSKTSTENQLASPLSIFIILLLAVAAVLQVFCLNQGLKVYDSTLVVPLFFAVSSPARSSISLSLMCDIQTDVYCIRLLEFPHVHESVFLLQDLGVCDGVAQHTGSHSRRCRAIRKES